jgi:hypothetical protein
VAELRCGTPFGPGVVVKFVVLPDGLWTFGIADLCLLPIANLRYQEEGISESKDLMRGVHVQRCSLTIWGDRISSSRCPETVAYSSPRIAATCA